MHTATTPEQESHVQAWIIETRERLEQREDHVVLPDLKGASAEVDAWLLFAEMVALCFSQETQRAFHQLAEVWLNL